MYPSSLARNTIVLIHLTTLERNADLPMTMVVWGLQSMFPSSLVRNTIVLVHLTTLERDAELLMKMLRVGYVLAGTCKNCSNSMELGHVFFHCTWGGIVFSGNYFKILLTTVPVLGG